MNLDESEIYEVRKLIASLNSKKNGIVVVEGKRDEAALKKLGFSGKICQFHSFKGLTRFVDSMPRYESLILLLDSDRKGKYLAGKIISQLKHRMTIDLSFRRKLGIITKGKIRNVEDLVMYSEL